MEIRRTLCVSIVTALLAACEVQAPSYPSSARTHTARVVTATLQRLPREFVLPGTVVVDERIDITSRITAFIDTVEVTEGQRIDSGVVLATLDGAQVEGAIRKARAVLRQAQAKFENARTDANRIENLFASDSATDSEMRGAKLQLEVASRAVDSATAAVQTAVAQRRYISITAPVSGVVIARHKQPGIWLRPERQSSRSNRVRNCCSKLISPKSTSAR